MDTAKQPLDPIVTGVIYVMGVSGCGKSTLGRLLACRLELPFCEADALHPDSNIRKMAAGTPLDDNDREPWLQQVRNKATEYATQDGGCVVACSALKRKYRDVLGQAHPSSLFVYMQGDFTTILNRMSTRTGHFMPESLLQSQFDALEVPGEQENVITVSVDSPVAVVLDQVMDGLRQHPFVTRAPSPVGQ